MEMRAKQIIRNSI